MNGARLQPFDSTLEGAYRVCPACLFYHGQGTKQLRTRFCRHWHPDGEPGVETDALGAAAAPHLHRVCAECGYEWLEETAQQRGAT